MTIRLPLGCTLLAVLVGTATADTPTPAPLRCCDQTPRWEVGVESGVIWANTEEIVEARPEHAADYLSYLTWQAGAGVVGLHLSYRFRGILE